jgi:multiple sugar transport system ATP-binding protein
VFVAAFTGSPAMNLVEEVVDGGCQPALGLERTNSSELRLGHRGLLGPRPERIGLPDGGKETSSLDFSVEVIEPTGPDVFVALKAGLKEIMARLPAASIMGRGRPESSTSICPRTPKAAGALKHYND